MESIINVKGKYENLKSEKGHGQVINRGANLGWEMNYSLNSGKSDIHYYPTKKAAKEALKTII